LEEDLIAGEAGLSLNDGNPILHMAFVVEDLDSRTPRPDTAIGANVELNDGSERLRQIHCHLLGRVHSSAEIVGEADGC
tara:strand:+ start:9493 stop:9729 length:237 start_codon:yes stop_codon:yes gene_type:complete